MLRTLFISIVTFCTIYACNGFTTPPTGPGTSYPCGVWGIECSKTETGSMCCPQNHICGYNGGFSRCPEGACCYDGDNWPNGAGQEENDAGKAPRPNLLPQYRTISNRGNGR